MVHPRQHSRGCLRRAEDKRSERPRPRRIAGRDTGRHRLRYGQNLECCSAAVDDARHRRLYPRRGHDGMEDPHGTPRTSPWRRTYTSYNCVAPAKAASHISSAQGGRLPCWMLLEPHVYRELAANRGWRITRVVETHVHADHLSRSRRLAEMSAAELHLPEQDRVSFPFIAIRDGDFIPVGATGLKALRTPATPLRALPICSKGKRSRTLVFSKDSFSSRETRCF